MVCGGGGGGGVSNGMCSVAAGQIGSGLVCLLC